MKRSHLIEAFAAALLVTSSAVARAEGPIQDNSFLIEEAYNQEPGVIQHIGTVARARDGSWASSFTEEWPVNGQTHQASVTLLWSALGDGGGRGVGDVALNYRWQAVGSGDTAVAFAPRLSLLLPTGDAAAGLGAGGAGLQVNLPMSVVLAERFVTHTNLGGTWVPSARASSGRYAPLASLAVGQSFVWLAQRRLNFLVEFVYGRTEIAAPEGVERAETLTVNPGVRAGVDLPGGLQIVPGVAFPIGVGPSRGDRAVFLYLSFEHPFRLAGPTEEEGRPPPAPGRDGAPR